MPAEQPEQWQLNLDAVSRFPRPGTNVPAALAFSCDSRFLAYLYSARGDLTRDLWILDLESRERRVLATALDLEEPASVVSEEEVLRRERQRLREGGITAFSWARNADRILVPIHGRLYVTSSEGERLREVCASDAPISDARLTSDGGAVVFVRGRELWYAPVDTGDERRLTNDASEIVSNGLAEYIAQEEMDRSEGFWISPDDGLVAYEQVDEEPIPAYPIVHQGSASWRVEHHRYPFAGGPNARVRLGVVAVAGGPTRWLELDSGQDLYLARVDWAPDGRLLVQVESRDQRMLALRAYDARSGDYRTLLTERSNVWVNLSNDLRVLQDGSFVWSSERTGYRHLEYRAPDGTLIRPLTVGEWPVDRVVHVDEAQRQVYFLASPVTPLEEHLLRVPLEGGEPAMLTNAGSYHRVTFAADGLRYACTRSSRKDPPTVSALDAASDGGGIALNGPRALEEVAPGLRTPELVTLSAADGTDLQGAIYTPTTGEPPFPTIISVYGGPHAQTVTETWDLTVDLRAQYLASRGFLVFKLDNRGSARRGLKFEGAIRGALGAVEIEDQVSGVQWLMARGLADPERVGIYGWSYGGYLAAMCLFRAPHVFKVGVAGAPVSAWDGYDTHYTERYLRLPSEDPDAYRAASALTYAAGLKGKLLIVHGMIDENVHFRHTARLVQALEEAGRPFDLLVLPNERHMPRGEAERRYLEERITSFLERHL